MLNTAQVFAQGKFPAHGINKAGSFPCRTAQYWTGAGQRPRHGAGYRRNAQNPRHG